MKAARNHTVEKALSLKVKVLSQEDQAAQAAASKARRSQAKAVNSGLTTRLKGHSTMQTARNQGKKDARAQPD